MSARSHEGSLTLPAAAASVRYLRVAVNSSGQWAIAGNTVRGDAVLENRVLAIGDHAAAAPLSLGGVFRGVAAAAFAVGAEVFAAAGGKIDDSGTVSIGTAVTAASADGDEVEWIPN